MPRVKNPLTFFTALFLFAVIALIRFYHPIQNIISWDTFGYYLYLPANFIYHDPGLRDLSWVNHLIDTYHPTSSLYQLYSGTNGALVIKYPAGFALMYSPFFFLAHFLAPMLGFPADGLSAPYQNILTLGAMIYTLVGLLLLRKLLLMFFNDRLSALIIFLVVAGTNYLQMASDTSLLTHNLLFGLYAFTLLITIKWHQSQKTGLAFLLGLAVGLSTMIRPTDGLIILIPLLWGIYDLSSFRYKINLLKMHFRQLGILILGLLLMGLPQLLYWKYSTGQFFFYSYQNPGEGLDFLNPHTINFLFSFRKGWLLYTPLMGFALWGLYPFFVKNKQAFTAITVFLLFYIYIVSCWSCWWYPGTLGQRPMVETYPVLALPFGYFLKYIDEKGLKIRISIGCFLFVFLSFNLFQTWQFSQKIIHPERMTKAYYYSVFGKLSVDENDKKLLLVERPGNENEFLTDSSGYKRRVIYYEDFEKSPASDPKRICDSLSVSGKYSIRIDPENCFSPSFSIPYKELTTAYYAWVRIRLNVYPFDDPKECQGLLVISFEHKGASYKYKAVDISEPVFKTRSGLWNKLSVDFITPEVRSKDDILKVYFWLRGKKPILIDDLSITVFDKPEQ